jgi:hypothetical protein
VPWIGPKSSSPAGVLPSTVGVDGERDEDDGQGGKAAECGLVGCVWKKETREKYPSMVLIMRAFKKRHFLSVDDGRTHWYSDDIAADILAWTLPHLCYVVFLGGAAESDSSSRCVLGICLPLQFATFDDVEEGFGSHDRRQFFTNLKFLHDASDESHGAFRDFLVHDKMEVIFFRGGGPHRRGHEGCVPADGVVCPVCRDGRLMWLLDHLFPADGVVCRDGCLVWLLDHLFPKTVWFAAFAKMGRLMWLLDHLFHVFDSAVSVFQTRLWVKHWVSLVEPAHDPH